MATARKATIGQAATAWNNAINDPSKAADEKMKDLLDENARLKREIENLERRLGIAQSLARRN